MNTLIKQTTKQAFAKVNFAKFALAMLTTAMLTACGGSDSNSTDQTKPKQTDTEKPTDTAAGVAVAYKVLHAGSAHSDYVNEKNEAKFVKVLTEQADYAAEISNEYLRPISLKPVDFTTHNVLLVTKGTGNLNEEVQIKAVYDTGDVVLAHINHLRKDISKNIEEPCAVPAMSFVPYIFVAVKSKKPIIVKRTSSRGQC